MSKIKSGDRIPVNIKSMCKGGRKKLQSSPFVGSIFPLKAEMLTGSESFAI